MYRVLEKLTQSSKERLQIYDLFLSTKCIFKNKKIEILQFTRNQPADVRTDMCGPLFLKIIKIHGNTIYFRQCFYNCSCLTTRRL